MVELEDAPRFLRERATLPAAQGSGGRHVEAFVFRFERGGVTPNAGSITCSLPHTAPKWATVAAVAESPVAAARSPRAPPHALPYPQ
jgi:hypothetical protein